MTLTKSTWSDVDMTVPVWSGDVLGCTKECPRCFYRMGGPGLFLVRMVKTLITVCVVIRVL